MHRRRGASGGVGRARGRRRAAASIAAHAAHRSSAPRVATRTPGCAPRRWRRERAPAASGGHAAMAREVTTRPAPPPSCVTWLTRPETWLLSRACCPRPPWCSPCSRLPTLGQRHQCLTLRGPAAALHASLSPRRICTCNLHYSKSVSDYILFRSCLLTRLELSISCCFHPKSNSFIFYIIYMNWMSQTWAVKMTLFG